MTIENQLALFVRPAANAKTSPFSAPEENLKKKTSCNVSEQLSVYIDGAARGNPGPAGAGVYVVCGTKVVLNKGIYLGNKTNNQAEYAALALALLFIKKMFPDATSRPRLAFFSDSELMVKQMKGEYKIKNEMLKNYKLLVDNLLTDVSYRISHVLREKNKEADRMANLGIDKKNKIPPDFLKILSNYGLFIR